MMRAPALLTAVSTLGIGSCFDRGAAQSSNWARAVRSPRHRMIAGAAPFKLFWIAAKRHLQ